jgi:hypothetical protein
MGIGGRGCMGWLGDRAVGRASEEATYTYFGMPLMRGCK